MSGSKAVSTDYLSRHFARVRDPYAKRDRVKRGFWTRYGRYMPQDKNARILDIGPGFGHMIEVLAKDRGYQYVEAVDISPEVVDFCNQILPGSTFLATDTIEFLQRGASVYDCIVLLHVLEHIPKTTTIRFLKAVHGALTPQGQLIVEVPNMSNPLASTYVRYADFTHEVGFTEESLTSVLEAAGFTKIEVFAPITPVDHWAKPLQIGMQKLFEFGWKIVYRGYTLGAPRVLSIAVGACAKP